MISIRIVRVPKIKMPELSVQAFVLAIATVSAALIAAAGAAIAHVFFCPFTALVLTSGLCSSLLIANTGLAAFVLTFVVLKPLLTSVFVCHNKKFRIRIY